MIETLVRLLLELSILAQLGPNTYFGRRVVLVSCDANFVGCSQRVERYRDAAACNKSIPGHFVLAVSVSGIFDAE